MSRSMVQVPEDMKLIIEGYQPTFKQTTNYGVIGFLIDYYERNEKQKVLDKEKRDADLQQQRDTMIDVGQDMKKAFVDFANRLGLRDHDDALEVLLEHFDGSSMLLKNIF